MLALGFVWAVGVASAFVETRSTRVVGSVARTRTGLPLGGAVVRIVREGSEPTVVLTDSDGRFEFMQVGSGLLTVTASKAGFQTFPELGTRRVEIAGDQTEVAISLWLAPLSTLSGRVTDELGRIKPGMEVTAFRILSPGIFTPARAQTRTEADGQYVLSGLRDGRYVIRVATPSGQDLRPVVEPSSADIDEQFHALKEGRPVASAGASSPLFVNVPVYYPGTPDSSAATVVPVSTGEEKAGLGVEIRRQPSASVEVDFEIGSEQGAYGNAVLVPWPVLLADRSLARIVQFDRKGHFTFASVPMGHYVLMAWAKNPKSGPDIVAWGELAIDVDRRNQSVRLAASRPPNVVGRISFQDSGATGSPIGTNIRLAPTDLVHRTFEALGLSHELVAVVGEDGAFEFRGVPAGGYEIEATNGERVLAASIDKGPNAMGFARGQQAIDVASEDLRLSVSISLGHGELVGSLKLGGDSPLGLGYSVMLARLDSRLEPRLVRWLPVQPDGRFRADWLAPGDYAVAVGLGIAGEDRYDAELLRLLIDAAVRCTVRAGLPTAISLAVR